MSLLKFEGMASHRMLVKGTLPHTPPTTVSTRLVPYQIICYHAIRCQLSCQTNLPSYASSP